MSDAVRTFVADDRAATEALFASAADRFRARRSAPARVETVYLDTFDGRLHCKGEALAWCRHGRGFELRWLDAADRTLRRVPMDRCPEYAADLPALPGFDTVARRIDVRRLLPGVVLRSRRRVLRILDEAEKTVARVVFDHTHASAPDKRDAHGLQPVLRVEPLRGFERAAEEVVAWLLAQPGARELAGTEVERARAALPGSAPTPPDKLPAPRTGDTARDATRRILLHQLEVMLRNEPGVRENLDTEFLHDFRVAVRRTRAALGQLRGVFPREERSRFRKELSWLGRMTGPVRDLDVYLTILPRYRQWLPAAERQHLEPLRALLERRHTQAHGELVRALDRKRYRRLVASWREFLECPEAPALEAAPDAGRPISALAAERIHAMWEKALARGGAIRHDTPADGVHRLRIDCKKLRYLLEFFGGLFPGADVRRAVRSLKKLQDNLGEFNDLVVQEGKLRQLVAGDDPGEGLPPQTLLAIGRLVERLDARRTAVRAQFHDRFEEFQRSDARARLERWFGEPPPEAP